MAPVLLGGGGTGLPRWEICSSFTPDPAATAQTWTTFLSSTPPIAHGSKSFRGKSKEAGQRLGRYPGLLPTKMGAYTCLVGLSKQCRWATFGFWKLQLIPCGATPSPRYLFGMAMSKGCMFILGGYDARGALDDMHMFCPMSMAWTELTGSYSGSPLPRSQFGFACAGTRLYVHGGEHQENDDFMVLSIPQRLLWKRGMADFLGLFDWDTLLVTSDCVIVLSDEINLCMGILPCTLSVVGQSSGAMIRRAGNGSMSCHLSMGCVAIQLKSVLLECQNQISWFPVVRVEGALFDLVNVTFLGCLSFTNGAVLQAFGQAVGTVRESKFLDCRSWESGGAIALLRSTVVVRDSHFENTTARLDGGGIWVGAFPNNFEIDATENRLDIDSSTFISCRALGRGGSISAIHAAFGLALQLVLVRISKSHFFGCRSEVEGGSLSASGSTVYVLVVDSNFTSCTGLSGGAIYADNMADVSLLSVEFRNNTAWGIGGGALHIFNSSLFVFGSIFIGNSAPLGGGGGLIWQNLVSPSVRISRSSICPNGSVVVEVRCALNVSLVPCFLGTCSVCPPGFFNSKFANGEACMSCPPGSFASSMGTSVCVGCTPGRSSTISAATSSSTCALCEVGHFAAVEGSSACSACPPGSYSNLSETSNCYMCPDGTYSSFSGATMCGPCLLGSFSSGGSSTCNLCAAGSYSTASESISCVFCQRGMFSSGVGARDSSLCKFCVPGSYAAHEGSSSCILCPKGYFAEQFSAVECVGCAGGKFSSTIGSQSSFDCQLCNTGQYSWPGSEVCKDCDAGTYSTGPGSASCDACPMGFYSQVAGATEAFVCKACNPGTYADHEGFSECSPCPAGRYSNESGSISCLPCAMGRLHNQNFNCSADDGVVVCDPGSISDKEGMIECSVCALRTYASASGSTQCLDCCFLSEISAEIRQVLDEKSDSTQWAIDPRILPGLFFLKTKNDASISDFMTVKFRASSSLSLAQSRNNYGYGKANATTLGFNFVHPDNFFAVPHYKLNLQKDFRSRPLTQPLELFCGVGNWALFGPCFASLSATLNLDILYPESLDIAFAGLPFSLAITLVDEHNQVVASDSSTVVQAKVGLGMEMQADENTNSEGQSLFQLKLGRALTSFIVRPGFSFLVANQCTALLKGDVHISVSGTSALTMTVLHSNPRQVIFGSGDDVCPAGYVLSLEVSTKSEIVASAAGACALCPSGTYSVRPLAHPLNALSPVCFNCPKPAICKGGSSIVFAYGRWVLTNGMYVLVECPRGNQLVNSIANVFSHDVQSCVSCGSDEYIIASNTSQFSCQKCPLGALCDGADLHGLVPGSTWTVDMSTGQYLLTSCPAGFEILNKFSNGQFSYLNQECQLCPPTFYCIGGSSPKVKCPASMFSPPGTNNSSSCIRAIYVLITVNLDLSSEIFVGEKQLLFRKALSFACGVDFTQVIINTVSHQLSRSLPSVRVDSEVAAQTAAEAENIVDGFDEEIFNRFLASQGLPKAALVAIQNENQPAQSTTSAPWVLVGALVGGGLLIALLFGFTAGLLLRRQESEEAEAMRKCMNALRTRLGITARDGYLLRSEKKPTTCWGCWSAREEYVTVQLQWIEAAVHMDMFQDFDLLHFDNFCLCLEFGDSSARLDDAVPAAYNALALWVREVAESLIRPSLPASDLQIERPETVSAAILHPSPTTRECPLRIEERFPYFIKRVSKVRIWSDGNGALFKELQRTARYFMDDIAMLCDFRFEELKKEPGGHELVTFFTSPEAASALIEVRRQDDPKVRAVVVHEEAVREASMLRLKRTSTSSALDEEVFIAQLVLRSRLLDPEFQQRVIEVVARHAVGENQRRGPHFGATEVPLLASERVFFRVGSGQVSSVGSSSLAASAAATALTEGSGDASGMHIARATDGASALPSAPPTGQDLPWWQAAPRGRAEIFTRLFVGSGIWRQPGAGRLPASRTASETATPQLDESAPSLFDFRSRALRRQSSARMGSSGHLGSSLMESSLAGLVAAAASGPSRHSSPSVEIRCIFRDGSAGTVKVCAAPVKAASRMREKLAEYAVEHGDWPLCAQILDPVRASVVCEGPARMLEVANWFLAEGVARGEGRGVDGAERVSAVGRLPICRVKNKFALEREYLVGGYRDLMLCGLMEGSDGLRIIGEVQVHDKVLHDLKLLMHKLYRICRAKSAAVI